MTDRGPDPARILAVAGEIAFPRYPGSAGDPQARAIVARDLQEAGLEVTEELFSCDLRSALRALTGAFALVGLSTLRSGKLSPGGVDNAGSVGVVLELARR